MNFKDNTFWITGASSGMGRATAIELAKKQVRLIISDRDLEGLKQTAEQIVSLGSEARIEPLDMSDNEAIVQVSERVIGDGEVVMGLYQFAGISQRSFVVETPIQVDRRIMEVNFFGVVALAKAMLPHMIQNGGGQLAVASSLVGKFGFPYRSAYAASKHALHGFFESLLSENYEQNIRVTLIVGGRIKTNISKFAIDKEGNEYGKMDAGQANGITPEKAAKTIVRGLRKEQFEVPVGGNELFMLKIKRFFPKLSLKLVRRINPT